MASLTPFTGALDKKKVAHLLRRTTFGPSRQQIDRLTGSTASQALAEIFEVNVPPTPSWFTLQVGNDDKTNYTDMFRLWALDLMRQGGAKGTSGIEKLVFFLHTIFTTRISIVENYAALYYQWALLRHFALGNIKELAKKISIDNAMLTLLDGRINVKGNPNENYARELFELFTIGKGPQVGPGDYTTFKEEDIKQAAKILSGWKVDDTFSTIDTETQVPTGILSVGAHDFTTKTFSSAFQNQTITPAATTGQAGEEAAKQELDDLIEMIFAQKATAQNICRRIYRFFMYYDITEEIERDIISPLADTLQENDYELQPVLIRLLSSQHFFDEDTVAIQSDNNRSAIIKSPLEISLGTLRFFDIQVADPYKTSILTRLHEQGLELFEPLDVAGYDAYFQEPLFNRHWISSNNLARRYEFGKLVIEGPDHLGFELDIVDYVKNPANISDPLSATTIVTELIEYLLPEALSAERYAYFYNLFTDGLSEKNWSMTWKNYQSSGNDMEVRGQLNILVSALLQSPEYQLF